MYIYLYIYILGIVYMIYKKEKRKGLIGFTQPTPLKKEIRNT